ncbi:MAG: prepilin peptidase [Nitrososphaerota archaeon]
MQTTPFLVNVIIVLLALLYASYLDLKKREIDDWVWIASVVIGFPIMLYDQLIIQEAHNIILVIVSISLTIVLGIGFYKAGFYGGADAKALITISLVLPLMHNGVRIHPFLPISTLLNGLISSLSIPLVMLPLNLYKLLIKKENLFENIDDHPVRKAIALFLGTKIKNPDRHKFWGPMEIQTKDGRRKFNFSPSFESFWAPLSSGEWATPSIPLVVFITAGFIIDLILGDIFSHLVYLFTS